MFFVTTLYYEVGATIPAGPLGRTLNEYGRFLSLQNGQKGVFGDGWRLLTEYVFEQIRKEQYAHLPSRLDCAFVFPTLEIAKNNGHRVLAPNTPFARRIYEVKPANPECVRHETDMSVIPVAHGDNYIPRLLSEAHRYWQGTGDKHTPEILLASDLRVIAVAEGESKRIRFGQE